MKPAETRRNARYRVLVVICIIDLRRLKSNKIGMNCQNQLRRLRSNKIGMNCQNQLEKNLLLYAERPPKSLRLVSMV